MELHCLKSCTSARVITFTPKRSKMLHINTTSSSNTQENEHSNTNNMNIITPGDSITTTGQGYMRGHGTYVERNFLVSSVAGVAKRVNKLISIKAASHRYKGEIGDVVVGRVTDVGAKRWKVDIGSAQDAVLMLSSVVLPGGIQRRRTAKDQLQMRDLFVEGDLVSAEIQNFYNDGAVSLHTRSLKYGKLENGQLVVVPCYVVKRLPQHFFKLSCGVHVLLGLNGYIWLTVMHGDSDSTRKDARMATAVEVERRRKAHNARRLSRSERLKIGRVANAIQILRKQCLTVDPDNIMKVYTTSIEFAIDVGSMMRPDLMSKLLSQFVEEEGEMDVDI